jgi:hypothetical protein
MTTRASAPRGRIAPRSLNDRLNVEPEVEEAHAESIVPQAEPTERRLAVWLNNASLFGRGAAVVDSTRLNPAAGPYFLPSAIPVAGEPFFGTGQRATLQGAGSAADITFTAMSGRENAVTGAVRVEVQRVSADDFRAQTPYAFFVWRNLTFGVTDSTFSDTGSVPETIDLGGPNARTWIEDGQALIRYTWFKPGKHRSGLTAETSIELPDADLLLPAAGDYSSFSRYPDFAAAVNYRHGACAGDLCNRPYFDELWHVQLAALVRDLSVENAADTVRESATGWGTQLSGRCSLFRRWCGDVELRDSILFSTTYGSGIGRYFNDLHLVNAVNDAAYNPIDNTLTPLPVFAYFVGYQHEWAPQWRSTAVYSHIRLDSRSLPAPDASLAHYQEGDYLAVNLLWHNESTNGKIGPKCAQQFVFAGVEYLYGEKENLGGDVGDAHRLMFVLAAAL